MYLPADGRSFGRPASCCCIPRYVKTPPRRVLDPSNWRRDKVGATEEPCTPMHDARIFFAVLWLSLPPCKRHTEMGLCEQLRPVSSSASNLALRGLNAPTRLRAHLANRMPCRTLIPIYRQFVRRNLFQKPSIASSFDFKLCMCILRRERLDPRTSLIASIPATVYPSSILEPLPASTPVF